MKEVATIWTCDVCGQQSTKQMEEVECATREAKLTAEINWVSSLLKIKTLDLCPSCEQKAFGQVIRILPGFKGKPYYSFFKEKAGAAHEQ